MVLEDVLCPRSAGERRRFCARSPVNRRGKGVFTTLGDETFTYIEIRCNIQNSRERAYDIDKKQLLSIQKQIKTGIGKFRAILECLSHRIDRLISLSPFAFNREVKVEKRRYHGI
jgi:hypothetical protein